MNTDVATLFVSIAKGLRRYNLTIFIVMLTGGLSAAVLILNATIQKTSDTAGYSTSLDITSFDQATIDRIKQLHSSSEIAADSSLPAGRINPFAE
jgi:hypothetical protein